MRSKSTPVPSLSAITRCFIYCRVSTQDQADNGSSLDTQLARARAEATARGWRIVGEESEDFSGAYLERPGLNRVREQVRAGAVDVLLAHAVDRVSRDQVHPFILFDELRRHHASLHSVTEGPIATAEDLIKLALYAYVAAKEREKIRERSMRGREEKGRQGRLTAAGTPLYGTRYVKGEGRRVLEAEQARVVEMIFRWVADERLSQHAIALRLIEKKIPSPTGKTIWHESTLRNMIRNPAYKGLAYQNKWRNVPVDKRRKAGRVQGRNAPRPENEWYLVPGNVTPRIVSDDLWERANAVMSDHARYFPRESSQPYLLTGRITCLECGCRYHGFYTLNKDRNKEYRYYKCGKGHDIGRCSARSLPLAETERRVWEYISAVLSEPRRVIAEMEAQRQGQDESQAAIDLASVQEQIAALDAKESRLIDLAMASEDAMATGVFVAKRHAIVAEREQWQAEERRLRSLVEAEVEYRITDAMIAHVERFCANVRTNLATASFERRREVLEALHVSLTVDTRGGVKRVTVAGWLPATEFVVENKSHRSSPGSPSPRPPPHPG